MIVLQNTKFKNSLDLIDELNSAFLDFGFKIFSSDKSLKRKKDSIKSSDLVHSWEKDFVDLAYSFLGSKNTHKLSIHYGSKQKSFAYCPAIAYDANPFSEALIFYILKNFVNKHFGKDIVVELNSLGDKDSAEKYLFDLKRFLKRNKKYLPARVKSEFEQGNYNKAMHSLASTSHPIAEDAPSILNYLSDNAQKQLYAFIDHLDNLGISYNLNPYLFASSKIWKYNIYNLYITDGNKQTLCARGGRLDNIASKIAGKETGLASLLIEIEKKGRRKKASEIESKEKNSKFFFIQIGSIAKAQGAKLLELMKNEKIDVAHSIADLSLIDQYALAKKHNAKYAIILGHKEAIDGQIIVRNIDTHEQEIIEQKDLIKKLKKLK